MLYYQIKPRFGRAPCLPPARQQDGLRVRAAAVREDSLNLAQGKLDMSSPRWKHHKNRHIVRGCSSSFGSREGRVGWGWEVSGAELPALGTVCSSPLDLYQ